MLENAVTTIIKKDAMDVGSRSWIEGIKYKTTNIASGFIASGLWPLSFPSMPCRLKLFKDGGIALLEDNQNWMACCETV